MPYFGAHMSVAGGYHKALEAAQAHACQSVQIFTKSPNQWASKPITAEEAHCFRELLKSQGLREPLAHDSYLINLASPDETLYDRSLAAFIDEMHRAELLGLKYLVMHPGAHMGAGEEEGLRRVVQALDRVAELCPQSSVTILLETTAGQGSTLGHRFEHLRTILAGVREPDRLGVCFDTCHVFAAGYELAPESAYHATLGEFDRLIGLPRLRAFHLNDSLKPRGSRVDRHAHLGRGAIGLDAFRWLVNDKRFRDRPMILETPKETEECDDMDAVNLQIVRELEKNDSRAAVRAGGAAGADPLKKTRESVSKNRRKL